MEDSKQSQCKFNYKGAFRRFLVPRPTIWKDLEAKIRTVYGIPADATLVVQYRDEEGDLITLNTDSELDEVLAFHTMRYISPVKFDVSVLDQKLKDLEQPSEKQEQPLTSTPAPPQLTAWRLNDHNQSFNQPSVDLSSTITSESEVEHLLARRHSNSPSESDKGDDVSIIDLENEIAANLNEVQSRGSEIMDDQDINYPQRDLVEATKLQERLEAFKIDAPVFNSSLGLEKSQSTAVSGSIQLEAPLTRPSFASTYYTEFAATKVDVTPTTVPEVKQQSPIDSYVKNQEEEENEEEENEEEEKLNRSILSTSTSTSTASTSTSDRTNEEDRALLEQFQQLIKEFQEVIQNNPQLVALASSIMCKIMSNVKVNVESFSNFLQMQAQNAHEAATQAAARAQEAAVRAQESAAVARAQDAAARTQEAAAAAIAQAQEAVFSARNGPFGLGNAARPRTMYNPRSSEYYGNGSFGNLFEPSTSSAPFNTSTPPMPPMPPLPPMNLMNPNPPMPPMPPMPPYTFKPIPRRTVPTIPIIPTFPTASPLGGQQAPTSMSSPGAVPSLGRSNTIHSSRPTPFSGDFPFNSTLQQVHANSRPVARDTEASHSVPSTESSVKNGKSKAVDVDSNEPSSSGSTSAMPGSFPNPAPKSDQKPGWSWARLDDEGSAHHLPPHTRAKYGWVWNDAGGEKTEVEESSTTSLYTPLKTTETIPGSFPGSFVPLGRGGESSGSETSEKLKRRQTVHGFKKQSDTENAENDRILMEENLKADLEHQKILAQMKREEEQRRNVLSRIRPMSSYDLGRTPTAQGTGERGWTDLSLGSVSASIVTPGEFPQSTLPIRRPVPAPAPAPVLAPTRQAPVPVTTIPLTTPRSGTATMRSTSTTTSNHTPSILSTNPFADQSEFEKEIKILASMGFPDDEELRTAVNDLGGEIEAVIDYYLTK
ncbi:hypothetical protein BGZ76_011416 [Entomortierella beljakovae]|nr:hypothetical protein BGZ76_011416 [Entomortierella beljakovae]